MDDLVSIQEETKRKNVITLYDITTAVSCKLKVNNGRCKNEIYFQKVNRLYQLKKLKMLLICLEIDSIVHYVRMGMKFFVRLRQLNMQKIKKSFAFHGLVQKCSVIIGAMLRQFVIS